MFPYDQLFILKSVINQRKFENKPTFTVFILDIENAYDKTWVDEILCNLWEKGIQGKIWRVIAKINRNLTTKVKTKFGFTKPVNITGGVRPRNFY